MIITTFVSLYTLLYTKLVACRCSFTPLINEFCMKNLWCEILQSFCMFTSRYSDILHNSYILPFNAYTEVTGSILHNLTQYGLKWNIHIGMYVHPQSFVISYMNISLQFKNMLYICNLCIRKKSLLVYYPHKFCIFASHSSKYIANP